ncbi:Drebrin-like protein [Gossypium australe]|uniref:Drebrin-like protein n=1 Tax=Gossypium australe TaxID=47621 RepID=A0A5B6V1R6_9ROSI|nr:Drebrin-like protein [Gossypium australe]
MLKLCLMVSHGFPRGLGPVLHQEPGFSRMVKEFGPVFPGQLVKQDMVQIGSFDLRCNQFHFQEQPKPVTALCETKLIIDADPTAQNPVVIDKPDAYLDTARFSFRIAEKCTRHEKILKFLMSGSNELENGELDLSLLSDLMGLQPLMFGVHQQPYASSLIYPSSKIDYQMPLPDFLGEMIHYSKITVNPDGQVVLTATGTEMKDILSIVAEFYLSSNSTKSRNQFSLVPYFDRKRITKARTGTNLSSPRSEVVSIAPMESPEKIKQKPSPKKNASRKLASERDLYKKNYFHACECLLSLMVDKRRHGRTAILSLKKSGPELPQFLSQFSAGIAGTGLAVLLSVIWKVACWRVPFCTPKLFSASIGFGLVWLSWAVNRLRDTVVHISKNTSKSGLKEEEMVERVEKSVNQIYFRAVTLMAIAVLRFA